MKCNCDEKEPEFHDIYKDGLWACSCYKPNIVNGEKPLDRVLREIDEKLLSRKKLDNIK